MGKRRDTRTAAERVVRDYTRDLKRARRAGDVARVEAAREAVRAADRIIARERAERLAGL